MKSLLKMYRDNDLILIIIITQKIQYETGISYSHLINILLSEIRKGF